VEEVFFLGLGNGADHGLEVGQDFESGKSQTGHTK
jgi:hypothetical protein